MMKRLLLVLTVLLSCVGCDQGTKMAAKAYLPEAERIVLLGGTLRLEMARNYGAFLSLGETLPDTSRAVVLTAGVAIVLASLLAYCLWSASTNPFVVPALALVVGGGLSNLLDRLVYGGYVLDFLNIGIGPVRTGIFNVADMFIMAGAIGLALSGTLHQERSAAHGARPHSD
jgi:signal peptidase II